MQPIIRSAVSWLSLIMAVVYFDVIDTVFDAESKVDNWLLTCGVIAEIVGSGAYFANGIRFVLSPRASQRITADRWYIVSPASVSLIVTGHVVAFFLCVSGLAPEYGVGTSLFLSALVVVHIIDIVQYLPV